MGELGSGYQDGRVGIQLSRWESWDAVIKMGVLEIQLSRWESWDPHEPILINELDGDHTNLYLLQAIFARY
jgi:hypothetical protein